jgi:hypothetical protein
VRILAKALAKVEAKAKATTPASTSLKDVDMAHKLDPSLAGRPADHNVSVVASQLREHPVKL